jgi:hypothetical protein
MSPSMLIQDASAAILLTSMTPCVLQQVQGCSPVLFLAGMVPVLFGCYQAPACGRDNNHRQKGQQHCYGELSKGDLTCFPHLWAVIAHFLHKFLLNCNSRWGLVKLAGLITLQYVACSRQF